SPLVPLTAYDELPMMTITRNVPTGGGIVEKSKATLIALSDSMDPEMVLRLVRDYRQTWHNSRLDLNTGILRFTYFVQCLGGTARDWWDLEANAVGGTNAVHFNTCTTNWIGRYIQPTDFADQQRYLEVVRKPKKLDCIRLSARLEHINQLMAFFPGMNLVPYTEQDLKLKFYNMMLDEWKSKFAASGNEIMDAGYTLRQLTRYMSVQEVAHNNAWNQRQQRNRNRNAGRHYSNNRFQRGNRGYQYPPRQRARIGNREGYGYAHHGARDNRMAYNRPPVPRTPWNTPRTPFGPFRGTPRGTPRGARGRLNFRMPPTYRSAYATSNDMYTNESYYDNHHHHYDEEQHYHQADPQQWDYNTTAEHPS
ncbi:MAG: hypothetical protein AAF412_05740, partial [Pseudomonadota bacterium]